MSLLGGAALSPRSVCAQQPKVPVVGFLNPTAPDTYSFNADAFRDGLAQAGFVEGRNVRIEYRWARGDYSLLPALAAELAALNVSAIAATGDIFSARSALGATRTIPIIFTLGADPVRHGLVASLNRPGGNATGINLFSSVLSAKRVQYLREIAPEIRRIGLLMNPDNLTAAAEQQEAQEGARALGREAFVLNMRNPGELDGAFAEFIGRGGDAYITASDPLILDRRAQIVAFGQQHGLPGIGFVKQFALAGSLLSYGPSITWMYYQAGIYVGEILKGAKVGELPVLQPTDFEMVINMKTAKALGLEPSPMLLAQATEVIE
jgi:putative tryptophan/tyrosine transport system substrate-binding protein